MDQQATYSALTWHICICTSYPILQEFLAPFVRFQKATSIEHGKQRMQGKEASLLEGGHVATINTLSSSPLPYVIHFIHVIILKALIDTWL